VAVLAQALKRAKPKLVNVAVVRLDVIADGRNVPVVVEIGKQASIASGR
jgi:hypothetical protein